jgi:hypothetical protein
MAADPDAIRNLTPDWFDRAQAELREFELAVPPPASPGRRERRFADGQPELELTPRGLRLLAALWVIHEVNSRRRITLGEVVLDARSATLAETDAGAA